MIEKKIGIKREVIIGAISAFVFISPNLNLVKALLYYAGVGERYTRSASIAIFIVIDSILFLGIASMGIKRKQAVILFFINILYVCPLIFTKSYEMLAKYILFVFPASCSAFWCAKDEEASLAFLRNLLIASRIMIPFGLLYILLLFVGTNRNEYGMLLIYNLTYGDLGYLFVPCFAITVIDSIKSIRRINMLAITVFSLAVIYSGSRSAMLCCSFSIFLLLVVFQFSGKLNNNLIKRLLAVAGTVVIAMAIGFTAVPSGSRLYAINEDFAYEAKADEKNDLMVIDVETKEERGIAEIYERHIIDNDQTKQETEKILNTDVSENRNEYIELIHESDREAAEHFSLYFHRAFMWRAAYKEFLKKPIAGNGFLYYIHKYDRFFPHNIFLEALSDFGAIGLMCLLFLGLWCFITGIRYFKKNSDKDIVEMLVLLFSYIPYYMLYASIYSNAKLLFTVSFFCLINTRNRETNKTDIPKNISA